MSISSHATSAFRPTRRGHEERASRLLSRLAQLAEGDDRLLIDEIPIRFLQASRAKKYSFRVLLQCMLKEYRHRNSRTYSVLHSTGKTKMAAGGALPNSRAVLDPMYNSAKAAHAELSRLCEQNARYKDTLRRREGSGRLTGELAHRNEALR